MHRFIDSGKISDNDFTFDIKRAPFGRKLSYISIKDGTYPNEEGTERSQLGIFRLPRKYAAVERLQSQSFPCVMSIRPVYGDISIPYECTATPSMLEVRTEYGYVQFCFDSKDILRIRGSRIGLRFFSKLNAHDGFVSRLDGTHQVTYDMVGEFLFVPVNGELKIQGKWNEESLVMKRLCLTFRADRMIYLNLHCISRNPIPNDAHHTVLLTNVWKKPGRITKTGLQCIRKSLKNTNTSEKLPCTASGHAASVLWVY